MLFFSSFFFILLSLSPLPFTTAFWSRSIHYVIPVATYVLLHATFSIHSAKNIIAPASRTNRQSIYTDPSSIVLPYWEVWMCAVCLCTQTHQHTNTHTNSFTAGSLSQRKFPRMKSIHENLLTYAALAVYGWIWFVWYWFVRHENFSLSLSLGEDKCKDQLNENCNIEPSDATKEKVQGLWRIGTQANGYGTFIMLDEKKKEKKKKTKIGNRKSNAGCQNKSRWINTEGVSPRPITPEKSITFAIFLFLCISFLRNIFVDRDHQTNRGYIYIFGYGVVDEVFDRENVRTILLNESESKYNIK